MRILFAISACAWAYIVGRCIAFGIHRKALGWTAILTTNTWYRLTPLKYPIPCLFLPYMPILFTLLKAYSLLLDDNTIHIFGVILLTSAQAFFPIFIVQIHSKYIIAMWALCNVVGNACYASLHNNIEAIPIYLLIGLHIWFLALEIQLYNISIVRFVPPYEKRQPRTV